MVLPQSMHFTSPANGWTIPVPSSLDRSAISFCTVWNVFRSMMASWVSSTRNHCSCGIVMRVLDL